MSGFRPNINRFYIWPARLPGRDEAALQTIRELVLPSAWGGTLARFVPVAPRASALCRA